MFAAIEATEVFVDGVVMTSPTGGAQWEEVFTPEAFEVVHNLIHLYQVASKASHLQGHQLCFISSVVHTPPLPPPSSLWKPSLYSFYFVEVLLLVRHPRLYTVL